MGRKKRGGGGNDRERGSEGLKEGRKGSVYMRLRW